MALHSRGADCRCIHTAILPRDILFPPPQLSLVVQLIHSFSTLFLFCSAVCIFMSRRFLRPAGLSSNLLLPERLTFLVNYHRAHPDLKALTTTLYRFKPLTRRGGPDAAVLYRGISGIRYPATFLLDGIPQPMNAISHHLFSRKVIPSSHFAPFLIHQIHLETKEAGFALQPSAAARSPHRCGYCSKTFNKTYLLKLVLPIQVWESC